MVQREHYPLKTVEKVAANLGDAKIFTTLDATSSFYQIKLAEESTWLATFNTPFGRYKFERLPFGILGLQSISRDAEDHVSHPRQLDQQWN